MACPPSSRSQRSRTDMSASARITPHVLVRMRARVRSMHRGLRVHGRPSCRPPPRRARCAQPHAVSPQVSRTRRPSSSPPRAQPHDIAVPPTARLRSPPNTPRRAAVARPGTAGSAQPTLRCCARGSWPEGPARLLPRLAAPNRHGVSHRLSLGLSLGPPSTSTRLDLDLVLRGAARRR